MSFPMIALGFYCLNKVGLIKYSTVVEYMDNNCQQDFRNMLVHLPWGC